MLYIDVCFSIFFIYLFIYIPDRLCVCERERDIYTTLYRVDRYYRVVQPDYYDGYTNKRMHMHCRHMYSVQVCTCFTHFRFQSHVAVRPGDDDVSRCPCGIIKNTLCVYST